MRNAITILLLIWCMGLSGCKGSGLSDLDKLFAHQPEISLSIQHSSIKSDDIGVPIYFACMDSLLFVSEMFGNNFITVFNTNDGNVVNRFAEKGRGPNEFLGVAGLYSFNDELLIQSTMPNRMVYIHSRDLLKPHPPMRIVDFEEDILSYLKISPVSDKLFMGTAMFRDDNEIAQFALADASGGFLSAVDQYPLNSELKSMRGYDLTFGFQGTLAPVPSGQYAIYYGPLHGVLKFFHFDGTNTRKIKEYIIAFPKFISRASPKDQIYGVEVSKESIAGAISVAVSDDSYYVLFSNKQPREFKSNTVYVFDLYGEPIQKIVLDEPIKAIVYSKKNNLLWTYREIEGSPYIDFIELPYDDKTLNLSGNVIDNFDRAPLMGVRLFINGDSTGVANIDGRFQILVKESDTIRFWKSGYIFLTLKVSEMKDIRNAEIRLTKSNPLSTSGTQKLMEVVLDNVVLREEDWNDINYSEVKSVNTQNLHEKGGILIYKTK